MHDKRLYIHPPTFYDSLQPQHGFQWNLTRSWYSISSTNLSLRKLCHCTHAFCPKKMPLFYDTLNVLTCITPYMFVNITIGNVYLITIIWYSFVCYKYHSCHIETETTWYLIYEIKLARPGTISNTFCTVNEVLNTHVLCCSFDSNAWLTEKWELNRDRLMDGQKPEKVISMCGIA